MRRRDMKRMMLDRKPTTEMMLDVNKKDKKWETVAIIYHAKEERLMEEINR